MAAPVANDKVLWIKATIFIIKLVNEINENEKKNNKTKEWRFVRKQSKNELIKSKYFFISNT